MSVVNDGSGSVRHLADGSTEEAGWIDVAGERVFQVTRVPAGPVRAWLLLCSAIGGEHDGAGARPCWLASSRPWASPRGGSTTGAPATAMLTTTVRDTMVADAVTAAASWRSASPTPTAWCWASGWAPWWRPRPPELEARHLLLWHPVTDIEAYQQAAGPGRQAAEGVHRHRGGGRRRRRRLQAGYDAGDGDLVGSLGAARPSSRASWATSWPTRALAPTAPCTWCSSAASASTPASRACSTPGGRREARSSRTCSPSPAVVVRPRPLEARRGAAPRQHRGAGGHHGHRREDHQPAGGRIMSTLTVPDQVARWFEAGDETILGVLTRPVGPARGVGVIFLNGGHGGSSSGKNRIYRAWPPTWPRGYHSLRIEWQGIGDSTGAIDEYIMDEPFVDDALGEPRCCATRASGASSSTASASVPARRSRRPSGCPSSRPSTSSRWCCATAPCPSSRASAWFRSCPPASSSSGWASCATSATPSGASSTSPSCATRCARSCAAPGTAPRARSWPTWVSPQIVACLDDLGARGIPVHLVYGTSYWDPHKFDFEEVAAELKPCATQHRPRGHRRDDRRLPHAAHPGPAGTSGG